MDNSGVQLYEDDVVYRPPLEVNSVLLEVVHGCTWGRCTFCRNQKPKIFRLHTPDDIERKLQMLSKMEEHRERTDLFLLGENTFALSPARLEQIFEMVHRYLPQIRKISMFARCDDVMRKTDDAMLGLKISGLGDLYIGLESGSDVVLSLCDKGLTAQEMVDTFHRLDRLGIGYSLSSIIGLGGRKYSRIHALETAALYSRIHPRTIRVMTLTPWPGTLLCEQILQGCFEELSPWEVILEERLFLSEMNLNVSECLFVGTHVSNNVPLVGLLPRHKEMMVDVLDGIIASLRPEEVTRTVFDQW